MGKPKPQKNEREVERIDNQNASHKQQTSGHTVGERAGNQGHHPRSGLQRKGQNSHEESKDCRYVHPWFIQDK